MLSQEPRLATEWSADYTPVMWTPRRADKAVRSPDRSGARIHPFHDHRRHTPPCVTNIALTYKSVATYTSPVISLSSQARNNHPLTSGVPD